jgi:predicted amidohydrolase
MKNFNSAKEIWKETHDSTISFLRRTSDEMNDVYLLGGTVVEEDDGHFYNTSTIWRNGLLLAKYRKINPIAGEKRAGVSNGHEPVVVETDFCKTGLLICADMFDPLLVKRIAKLGSEMIYLPVAAMGTHPSVKGHPLTEKVAAENGLFVLKAGNVCSSTKGGRSAIITPWGTVAEVSDSPQDTIITSDLDMEKLRAYRKQLQESASQ